MAKKTKVRLLVSFAGDLGGVDSPSAGTIIEVDAKTADALCSEPAEDPRAEYVVSELKTTRRREQATSRAQKTAETR